MARKARVVRAVTQAQLFKVEGVEELLESIGRVQVGVARELKKVFMKAGLVILEEARRNVDKIPDSAIHPIVKDALKVHIIAGYGSANKANVLIGVVRKKRDYAYKEGAQWVNPYWFEFGTVTRSTGAGANRGRMRETPFFRPAVAAKKTEVRDVLAAGIKETLERMVDKSK